MRSAVRLRDRQDVCGKASTPSRLLEAWLILSKDTGDNEPAGYCSMASLDGRNVVAAGLSVVVPVDLASERVSYEHGVAAPLNRELLADDRDFDPPRERADFQTLSRATNGATQRAK
jgi:hypothetical protein